MLPCHHLQGTWRLCYISALMSLCCLRRTRGFHSCRLNNVCLTIYPNLLFQLDTYLKPPPSNQLEMSAYLRSTKNISNLAIFMFLNVHTIELLLENALHICAFCSICLLEVCFLLHMIKKCSLVSYFH